MQNNLNINPSAGKNGPGAGSARCSFTCKSTGPAFLFFLLLIFMAVPFACNKYPEPIIVATLDISKITSTSAASGGLVVYGEDTGINGMGLVWGTSPDPSLESHAGALIAEGTNPEFKIVVVGLQPSTEYYIRAWASRGDYVAYGNELRFRTSYGSVTDIDGNTYNTLRKGSLEWMGSNLETSMYRNGDTIPNITGIHEWRTASEGAWSYYMHSSETGENYGKLYNWHATVDDRGLCPAGWHVPTDEEWKELEREIGMLHDEADIVGLRDRYAGGKLKATGTDLWRSPNALATNGIGFTALPGGYRHPDGRFYTLRRNVNFWTSTAQDGYNAWYRNIFFNNGGIYRNSYNKTSGFSIRCVRRVDDERD